MNFDTLHTFYARLPSLNPELMLSMHADMTRILFLRCIVTVNHSSSKDRSKQLHHVNTDAIASVFMLHCHTC